MLTKDPERIGEDKSTNKESKGQQKKGKKRLSDGASW